MDITDRKLPVPAAVLWDMDGTLIDSEEYWIEAETQIVEKFGGHWSTEQGLKLVGNSLESSAAILQGEGVALKTEEIISSLLRHVSKQLSQKIPYRPGSQELLEECRQAGIKMGLVTMSHFPVADVLIRGLPHKYFDVVVTGDQVKHGKPDPEPYNKAYGMMKNIVPGLKKPDVVVIEDSVPGVKSALAAGLKTIAVPNVVVIPEALATATWDSLKNKGTAQLARIVSQEASGPLKTNI